MGQDKRLMIYHFIECPHCNARQEIGAQADKVRVLVGDCLKAVCGVCHSPIAIIINKELEFNISKETSLAMKQGF